MTLLKFTPHMISNQPDQTAYLLNKLAEGRSGGGGGSGTLYDTTGQHTDGAMTQKATTDALGTKADSLVVGQQLAAKVDKVPGKELSDNNFTDEELGKLNGIQAGAEVNVQSDWDQTDNTADDFIKNKPTIPTATSDLQNDSGFITTVQTGNIAEGAVTAPKLDWTTAGATRIPANSDLNTTAFITPGKYFNGDNAEVVTMTNCPTQSAFSMWVINALGADTNFSDMTKFYYLDRILMNYFGGTFIQAVFNGGTDTWSYGRWIRCSSDLSILTGNNAGTINTTYVDQYGGAHTIHRIGDLVIVNINIRMKAGSVPNNAPLITGLPSCSGSNNIVSNMVGNDGQAVRLIMNVGNDKTSLFADGGFTATLQYYNGQIIYMSA